MSDAGRAWYDRILRDERDRVLHNERATAQDVPDDPSKEQ